MSNLLILLLVIAGVIFPVFIYLSLKEFKKLKREDESYFPKSTVIEYDSIYELNKTILYDSKKSFTRTRNKAYRPVTSLLQENIKVYEVIQ